MKRKKDTISHIITAIALVIIGLLAIPAGILFLLITGIWSAADHRTMRLHRQ